MKHREQGGIIKNYQVIKYL